MIIVLSALAALIGVVNSAPISVQQVAAAFNDSDHVKLDKITDGTVQISVLDTNGAIKPPVDIPYAQFRALTKGCVASERRGDIFLSCPQSKTTNPCFFDAYQVKLEIDAKVRFVRAYKSRELDRRCAPPVQAAPTERG